MREKLRKLLPLTIAVAMVAGLGAAPVAAQSDDGVAPAAGINADRVDGKHAVSATGKAKKRAGKLVATNKQGLLPSNILRPIWSLIQGIPGVLADGLVGFDEIAAMPAAFADGQIAFGEVTGTPAGFADGVDDVGVSSVKLTRVNGTPSSIPAGTDGSASATCPAGSSVTGGGFFAFSTTDFNLAGSLPSSSGLAGWFVDGRNTGILDLSIIAYAICMSVEPAGAFTTAKKGLLPASVKKAMKKRNR